MRSSLTEPHAMPGTNSYPASSVFGYQPSPQPPYQPKQQSRLVLAPAEGWLPLLLLAVAVYSVVYSVMMAINVNHNFVLWITTAIGLLVGLSIAKSKHFPQIILHVAACIIGYWLALFLTSYLAYHISILYLLSTLRTIISSGFALTETQNSDLIFLFYLSFLCFFLGYFGSWLVYRAHLPWLVAFVYIAIMLVNLNYVSKSDPSFLVVILLGSLLLLIARMQLANQLAQWKSDGLHTDHVWLKSLTTRFLQVAAVFLVLILPLSWLTPIATQPAAGTALWSNLDNAWANLAHGRLPALNNPNGLFSPYNSNTNFFGNQLTITGSVNLPNGPVLSYTSAPQQGQYLESFTFNTFDGHTWTEQGTNANQSFPANATLPSDVPNPSSSLLSTQVTIIAPPDGTKTYIFAPAQPTNFTVPITILSGNSGSFTSTWTQTTALTRNEHYEVSWMVPDSSPADLETLPLPDSTLSNWPPDPNEDALHQYYLQTPSDLSRQVLATAQQWTTGATNAYDAVSDLQAHLSNPANFTYSLNNPAVPANTDAVTWLLQTKQGYCTYFATAMTVMARLLNIPARIVNGFSQGSYDAKTNTWIVNGSDAHSWVQVYFPGSGWINFDPTPGFSLGNSVHPTASPTSAPTKQPAKPKPTPAPVQHKAGAQPTPTSHQNQALGGNASPARSLLLLVALLLLLGTLAALGILLMQRRSRRARLQPIESVYARLCRVASLIGSPPASWQTPYEYTFSLSRRFPQAAGTLRHLTDLFVRERWASPQQAPDPGEKQELERLWPRLRNMLLHPSLHKER
jgi:transglutaminase-like putative cysteine protease